MVHPGACNTFNFIVLVENANRLTNDEFAIVDISFFFFIYIYIYVFVYVLAYVGMFLSLLSHLSKREILKRKGCG